MIIVDTNVLSEPMRPAPEPRVLAWIEAQDLPALHVTAITFGEIAYGVERLPGGRRKTSIRAVAQSAIAADFDGTGIVVLDPWVPDQLRSSAGAQRGYTARPISSPCAYSAANRNGVDAVLLSYTRVRSASSRAWATSGQSRAYLSRTLRSGTS